MKKRELSPLADPVFKRVFGEEKEILMELINAVFEMEHPVVSIEYLPTELLPENFGDKTTIVDVRCTDDLNRHFIVEMQVLKQKSLQKRALFNAARVYGRQMTSGEDYEQLKPVYALCLVDHILESDTEKWRHKYKFINEDEPHKSITEIEVHFIDLSKCRKRNNFNIANPLDRWINYLINPDYIKTLSMNTEYNYPNLKKALELLDESNYSEGQLVAYDKYLDSIRSWNSSMKLSYEEGRDEGWEDGRVEGWQKGREEERQLILKIINDLREGISVDHISTKYGVEVSFVEQFIQG